MSNGTIQIRSGRWDWTVRAQASGAAVVFHHRNRMHDELRTWSSDPELDNGKAEELAHHPIERVWADADGIAWSITVEMPTGWRRGETSEDRMVWLLFIAGSSRRQVLIPESTALGDLTHAELSDLFRKAT
jgi:hypothetical protein